MTVVANTIDTCGLLPQLLGYYPENSLVAICLHGSQPGLILRVDLPGPEEDLVNYGISLLRHVAGQNPDGLLLMIYADVPMEPRPHQDLIDIVLVLLSGSPLDHLDILHVNAGRCRTYLCDDDCCPPQAFSAGPSDALRALLQDKGHSTEVVESVEVVRERVLAHEPNSLLQQQIIARCPPSGHRFDRTVWDRLDRDLPTMADQVLCLADVHIRDALIQRALQDPAPMEAHLRYLLSQVGAPWDAPLATLTGWLLYMTHSSSVETVALCERALASAPGYNLAKLLLLMIQEHNISPDTMRSLTEKALGS